MKSAYHPIIRYGNLKDGLTAETHQYEIITFIDNVFKFQMITGNIIPILK